MPDTHGGSGVGRRPLIITLICAFNFIGYAISFLSLVIPQDRALLARRGGVAMVPIAFTICILAFIGMVGYWKMHKWGVWFYFGMAVISFGSDFLFKLRLSQTGAFHYFLIISVIAIGLVYSDRMT